MMFGPNDLIDVVAAGGGGFDQHRMLNELIRLAAAFGLACVIGFRPWRWLMRKPPVSAETAHAQVLIAVAAAVIVIVIGDNLARAFGLMGLGGFVRFRSGIKDPRDATVMFLAIGVGMACGLDAVPTATLCTGFASLVLAGFDGTSSARPNRLKVIFVVEDARTVLPALREAYPNARVLGAPSGPVQVAPGAVAPPQKIVLEMDIPENMDAAGILAGLGQKGVTGVREVVMTDD
jgi:hypothetical protein